jgi:hypothetical protein
MRSEPGTGIAGRPKPAGHVAMFSIVERTF